MSSLVILRDPTTADRVIAFINQLPIVDGDPAVVGKSFKVDPWMEAWLRDILEPKYAHNGRNVVREAFLTCARKNAKSYLVSGLLLAYLVGPLARPNGQIYSAAINNDQSMVIFEMCAKMIAMVAALRDNLQVVRSKPPMIRVKNPNLRSAGSKYIALTAEVSSKHGLGADFFVYDEYGEAKDGELWSVLFDSQQLRHNPLGVAISTQNNDPNHPFTKKLDAAPAPHRVVHIHAAPEGCDLMDEAAWLAANPALATWKSKEAIAVEARNAIEDPTLEANFRRRYLNQRVAAETQFFNTAHLIAASPNGQPFGDDKTLSDAFEFEDGERVYLGLDVSKRTDLTVLVAVSADDPMRVKSWFWKPADLVQRHTALDKQPYDVWAANGWLITPAGETIAGEDIAEKILELHERLDIAALVYDFNHADDIIRHIRNAGLTVGKEPTNDLRGIRWGNAANDGAKAVNAIEDAIVRQQLQLCGNPIMLMCLAHAVVKTDHQDRRMFVKGKATQRIDGAVALSIALACRTADINDSPQQVDWGEFSIDQLVQ